MTKKQYQPQTVVEAEAVLAELSAKRDKLLAFGEKLIEARKANAYAAHTGNGSDARRSHSPACSQSGCD
jgi:hypothetical protein